jgi:hypothetical protein
VLDPGGYDLISVNKSISSVQAGILPSGADAVTISAGANDAVRLRGLFIEAATPGSNTGIHIVSAGSVYIDHCSIRGFATGISLESTGVTKVFVSDCEITLKHDGPDAEHDGRAFLSPVQSKSRPMQPPGQSKARPLPQALAQSPQRLPMNQASAISTRPAAPATMPCLTCTRATPASCPGKKPGSESAGTMK